MAATGLGGVAQVSANGNLGLAVTNNGELFSWGSNVNFSTAQGTDVGNTEVPTQVGSDTNWAIPVAGNGGEGLAIKTDGTLWSWGDNVVFRTGLGTNVGDTEVPTEVDLF